MIKTVLALILAGVARLARRRKRGELTTVARADSELPRSLERSPGILVSTCLDVTADAVQAEYQFNAGWSCFGSSSVVVPSSPK